MKANIKNGIRYSYSTSPAFSGNFYASIALARRHTYSKSTAYGERTRWKVFGHRELGKFESRTLANIAAKAWIAQRMAAT